MTHGHRYSVPLQIASTRGIMKSILLGQRGAVAPRLGSFSQATSTPGGQLCCHCCHVRLSQPVVIGVVMEGQAVAHSLGG